MERNNKIKAKNNIPDKSSLHETKENKREERAHKVKVALQLEIYFVDDSLVIDVEGDNTFKENN